MAFYNGSYERDNISNSKYYLYNIFHQILWHYELGLFVSVIYAIDLIKKIT